MKQSTHHPKLTTDMARLCQQSRFHNSPRK